MLEILDRIIETVFGGKSDVALLSHKIQSKDKEMKRYSKIWDKYNPRKNKLKKDSRIQVNYEEEKNTIDNYMVKTQWLE